jgi:hypothetical protein
MLQVNAHVQKHNRHTIQHLQQQNPLEPRNKFKKWIQPNVVEKVDRNQSKNQK